MDCITNAQAKSRKNSLWRHPDFLKLWVGQTVSELGSRITREGLPLTAVLVLGAGPAQMGLLAATGAASVLLFGLVAGLWTDRLKRRPILIAADLLRAAVLAAIPLAAWAHRISMPQLYGAIAVAGLGTVFFDVAYQSYLPSLVRREELVEGNSKLAQSDAIAEIVGPSLTGVLVQLITAPVAILFDSASFLVSAVSVWTIRKPEPAAQTASCSHWKKETMAVLRFIFGHPVLRPLASFSACGHFFFGFIGTLYVLYAIRDLRVPPAALGAAITVGGLGAMLGAAVAPRVARALGRVFVGSMAVAVLSLGLLAIAGGPLPAVLALLMIQQLFGDAAFAVFNVNELALRQSVTPAQVLGRVNGAMQLLTRGIYPLGALVGGALAERIGIRGTLAVAAGGLAVSSLWLLAPPLRKLSAIPGAG
ncbi:MAG TPA: MFS transporter [Bryobacteraceae bacterium]|nr:MFS transporter [Bryobacteraceae bacterium]